jgi:hypothetical protein
MHPDPEREKGSPMFARTLPLLALPAAAMVLAGCGSSAPQASPAAATAPAGMLARSAAGTYTARELSTALLGKINGESPAIKPEAGPYGSLPEVLATKSSMRGVAVTPAKCAQATLTGFDSATFSDSPAAVTTFRVGRDGVSEVLMSPSAATASQALGSGVPSGCSSYRAVVSGKTFSYRVSEASVSGVGTASRALNIRAVGYPEIDVWSLVYRGSGMVGAITIVGQDASEAAARQLAEQAYKYATDRLS